MSWEEFKKKKEQKSSWQEFKSQKQNKVQYTLKKQETSLWQNIQNLAGDIGRSTQNLFLGASSGAKQSFNYGLKTAESKFKTEQRAKAERVLGSKELSNSDKAIYIAGTLQNHKKNNIQDVNLPTIKSIVGEGKEKYDKEKVEGIANKNILDKSIEKDQKKIQENINAQTNNVTKKLAELAPSIGNMGVGAALSAVNPALGTAYFTTSAGGSYIQDAEERGMTRKDAITYGSIMGLMEGATEAIGWENLSKAGKGLKTLIKGTGKTLAKEGVEQVTKNSIKTILKDYGVGIAENAIQELLIEPIQEITAGAVAGKDKANWSDIGQRMLKSGIDGGLTSAIVGGANLGIQSCVGVVEKTQKGQGITTQELQIAVKDASKKLDVEKMITDSTQHQIQKYKDYNTNKTLNKDSQNWLKQAEDIISQNNASNSQPQLPQKQQNTSTQQIMPTRQENAQNGNIEQVNPYRNVAKANKLVKEKNNKIREVEEQIKQGDSAAEKGLLQEKINQIESKYNNQIQELYDSTNEYSSSKQENISLLTETMLPMPTEKLPISTENRLKKAISDSLNNKTPKGVVTLGNVSKKVSEKINNLLGINVNNRRHTLSKTDIRHMLNEHGNPEIEAQKGQIAITEEDILKIPDIIDNYDDIVQGSNNKQGKTIRYIKSFSDNTSYVVEVVPENSDTLNIKTMWKKPTALTNSQTTLDSTSETTDSSISSTSNNIIPQNEQNMQVQQENLPVKESNAQKYDRYKKNILEAQAAEVNNLIKTKNQTLNIIEQQIAEKEQLLNRKKDKTTKVANNLKMQIENLEQRKTKIENEYNSRIDRKFDKVTKDKINLATKKELGITRKDIQQNLLEDTGMLNESLDNAQNISMANMNRTDPIRLQEKVFGKELGTKINDMFFKKIKHNTAEKTRFLNSERSDIKNWGIKARSFESEVLQKYTEKTYVTEDGNEMPYTEADLIKDVPNEETRNKIKKASEELRKKYDNYIETANEVLVGLGYDAIPKRKDYVRHFTELNDIFTKFGIPGKLDNALPTDINGITDTFRPGKNFFANAQKRYGNKTTYDAITGVDGYIDGISNLIYHTEDIQRLRALDKYIRENYGEKGFENLDNLSEEDKKIRMEKISENHLSNYVSWLTEYTNNLAGKKSGIDRSVEKLLGRNVYSALDTIKKQTGSNMTGFNIGSALTNFISVVQGASKTKKLALLKGTASTIQNIFNNDGFVDKSDFLTSRFGSDRISNTLWQKVSNAGQVFMSATDYFTSNLIVRSKYYENLAKGMGKTEALKNADDFGARILGDRAQGSTANVFNSKMLGILTQFQLEVNNQMDTMLHDSIQDFKTTANESGSLKASMGAVWTLGQMAVYQYVFNELFQAIAGRRPAFDIIDIIKTALGINDDDEKDELKDNLQQASLKLIEALPFANLLSEDARIPIASAIPNPISIATGDSTLKDEVSKLVYLLPPTGGSQAKKSIDGIKTVIDGGSYVTNSKGEKELRFPVENTSALDYIKAGILGKYSLPLAQEYVDRDYKRLSAKQTKTYEESKVPFKEYLEYIEARLKTNEDKINYLESKEMNTEQKWGIYTNDLFSSTERKEDGGSQLSDAKYITSNGVSKSEYIRIYNKAQTNNIDMPTEDEYKEMKSNNISLSNYIDYKIKVKDLTESKRKSKELSDTENLKNADKIQILLDSNYSNKEISGIYTNYIKSEKDTEYDIMKATGIDIKEYLKYKQQEFTSDKTDDGTLAGKAVSKSKQKKVVEYLNSNIKNGNQRLLLYAMQGYNMTTAQKAQIANYVKELKIDNDTKLKLYDKFSGFTVYKDGTVKW